MRALLFGTVCLALASPANAASVFGTSLARECYESAQLGNDAFGIESCDKALKQEQLTESDRAATLVNRGIILNRARKLDAALADFSAALKAQPESAEAFLNRGNTYFFRREFESALGDYSRAIELETSDLHVAYFNRALVHEVMKDYEAAKTDLNEALRLAPNFVQATERLAIVAKLEAGLAKPAPAAETPAEEAPAKAEDAPVDTPPADAPPAKPPAEAPANQ